LATRLESELFDPLINFLEHFWFKSYGLKKQLINSLIRVLIYYLSYICGHLPNPLYASICFHLPRLKQSQGVDWILRRTWDYLSQTCHPAFQDYLLKCKLSHAID